MRRRLFVVLLVILLLLIVLLGAVVIDRLQYVDNERVRSETLAATLETGALAADASATALNVTVTAAGVERDLSVAAANVTVTAAEAGRATAMAGASAGAVALGRDAESRRILPLAVIVLLLVDPFLARSLAFRLSVAASAGIIWWSGRISLALPGPRPVASALGVTTARGDRPSACSA